MSKTNTKLIAIFALLLVAMGIYVGATFIGGMNNNSIQEKELVNEDYQIKEAKEKLSKALKDDASIVYEIEDSTSALIKYTDKTNTKIVNSIKDNENNYTSNSKWKKLVKQLQKISKKSKDITISIVTDQSKPDDAYLVLFNGKVYFDITKN